MTEHRHEYMKKYRAEHKDSIPKKIKELLKQRENYAMKYLLCESKLNDWLESKGIFQASV